MIISGGHPGAEKAALDAALKLDIPHGGWAYKGRITEEGPISVKYNVKETFDKSFKNRIEKNVLDSTGTVIFAHGKLTIGLKIVEELATRYNRPCLHIDLNNTPLNAAATAIRAWMLKNKIEIVYFTGQKSVKGTDIYSQVIGIIEGIYRMDTAEKELQDQ